MGREYYSPAARYWFVFYFKNRERPSFQKDKARENWDICHMILSEYSPESRRFIEEFYMNESEASLIIKKYDKFSHKYLWMLVREIEKKFREAKRL